MSRLVWDAPGERLFAAGLDKGVLYASNQRGRAWNGLLGVDEDEEGGTNTPFYQDGVKTSNRVLPGGYTATVQAYTYPDQLEPALGYRSIGNGLYAGNQLPRPFSMSYRTGIGNDVDGLSHAYRIHIIYNATIVAPSVGRNTVEATLSPDVFSWSITSKPAIVAGFRPTSHFIIDSRDTHPFLLQTIESVLWGREGANAWLISAQQLVDLYRDYQPSGYGYGLYGRTNGYGHGNEYEFLG